VMLNILNNAIKYNNEGGNVTIRVDEKTSPASYNDVIRVSVTDSGLSIPEADLQKIFTPFERIGAEKSETEGTGLGLAVVKKLVELMEGDIGVTSEHGKGSTFWFELPLAHSEVERVEMTGQLTEVSHGTIEKHGTVFYIEDNVSNIDLVEQILTGARPGVRLVTSLFGKNADRIAADLKPDLILLDLNLPDIHGSEVFGMLKENPVTTDIPVVIISADAMPHQSSRMREAGAVEYLTKPLDIELLLKIIDEILK